MRRAGVRAGANSTKYLKSNRFAVLSSYVHEINGHHIRDHFHIPITLRGQRREKDLAAMVDSGASSLFMNPRFVRTHKVKTRRLRRPISVFNIDGTPNREGEIRELAFVTMQIGETHTEEAVFAITDIGPEDVILGIEWLRKHNLEIDWESGSLRMLRCPEWCCQNVGSVNSDKNIEKTPKTKPVDRAKMEPKEGKWMKEYREKEKWIERRDERKANQKKGQGKVDVQDVDEDEDEEKDDEEDKEDGMTEELFEQRSKEWIRATRRFTRACRKEDFWEVETGDSVFIHAGFTYSQRLAEAEAAQKEAKTFEEMVPERYRQYADVFLEKRSERLPEHRLWDHAIDIVPEAQTEIHSKVYPLPVNEQGELDRFLDENLAKGYIVASKSPMASPVFFIKKKDGKLRLIQDYRKLNEITVKNRYPLPLISELVDKLRGAKYFTKFDVRWGYHNVRIKEGDEWKAAFVTNRGLYEPRVMYFGLTNSPATFQSLMNHIFRDLIAQGVVAVYLDDIIIFTKELGKHREVVEEVLKRLREHDLYLKPEKCEFEKLEVEYLGLIISEDQTKMDPVKVKGIADWPTPTTASGVRQFRGFANFYRRFIEDFGKICKPLDRLTGNV